MKDIQIRNQCEDCKYFVQHYVQRSNLFRKTSSGHCTQRNTKLVKEHYACTNWQEQEIKININQNSTIKKQLAQIASQLNAISNYIIE